MATDEEIIDCIQLINSEKVGPITFYKLLEVYKNPKAVLEALPKLGKFKLFPRTNAKNELQLAKSKKVRILIFSEEDYPENLRVLEDAPPVLYVLGNVKCLHNPLSISIVGARNASINGRKTASKIAYDLTNNDVIVISGMARGIDAAAHKGAMHAQNQQGMTIAVLGTGVDVVYPNENKALYEQICQNGAIVSEFPLGTEPQANNFPRRNRIVSALSLGTLVVEASVNSGSLITARLALEQGKDIFAIPGSPNEERSLGPNKLIKDGAILVESADDILQNLVANNAQAIKKQAIFERPKTRELKLETINKETNLCPQTSSTTKIIDYLSRDGVYVDEIIRASGWEPSKVALELLELELNGRIERQTGNKVALIK